MAPYLRKRLPLHPLERKWNTSWELILDAIARSGDISQRGIRGLIAEAAFESRVIPKLRNWKAVTFVGDLPFDFKLQSVSEPPEVVTIQVKLQRMEKALPLAASKNLKCFPDDFFIAEVQKTRSGEELEKTEEGTGGKKKTRPYRFGEFDILAVSMHPSTADWSKFMYTVGSWLLPREKPTEQDLIRVMQPVSPVPSEVWTDDLQTCIDWLLSKEKRLIFDLPYARERCLAARKEVSQKRAAERLAQKRGKSKHKP